MKKMSELPQEKMSSSGHSGSGPKKQIAKTKQAKMRALSTPAKAGSKMKSAALNVLLPIIDEYTRDEVKVPHPAWTAERTSGVHAHTPQNGIYTYR